MKRITMITAVLILLLSTTAWAQKKEEKEQKDERGFASITLKVDGLTCNTSLGTGTFAIQAWSFGAQQSGSSSTGGGGGAGKATISDLNVQKHFDECSPALFGAVTTGKHIPTVSLVQQDKKSTVMTVTLTDVLISSYQIGGSQGGGDPQESVSFTFAKVCINDVSSGKQACFDFKAQKAD